MSKKDDDKSYLEKLYQIEWIIDEEFKHIWADYSSGRNVSKQLKHLDLIELCLYWCIHYLLNQNMGRLHLRSLEVKAIIERCE